MAIIKSIPGRPRSHALAPILLLAAGILVSCNSNQAKPEGHYEGTLLKASASGVTERPVTMDVTYDNSGAGTITVKDEHSSPVLSVIVPNPGVSSFNLRIDGVLSAPVTLNAEGGQVGCFQNGDGTQPGTVEFCFDADRIYLEIGTASGQPTFALSGNHFAAEPPFTLETPASFTLKAAVDSALARNFDSRIEAEHYIEVKYAAKAAWLELLPHLSISSVLGNLPITAAGLLGAIADLVPFAIPSNWFHAHEASVQASAEKDALILLEADLASEVEGLAYALKRDEGVLDFYSTYYGQMQVAYLKVQQLHATPGSGFDSGSPLQIKTALNAMELDMEGLKLMIAQDKTALAQALGLHNPEGVTEMDLGTELVPIDSAHPLKADDIYPIALARSFELQQQDALLQIAKTETKAVWFNWLTPSSDPSQALGPAIGEQFAVSKEQVLELTTHREETQAALTAKVDSAVDDYNSALTSYALSTQRMELQTERWNYEMSMLVPGSGLNTQDVEGVEQDWVESEVQFQTIITSFRVARANLDRLMLQGYYLELQKNLSLGLN